MRDLHKLVRSLFFLRSKSPRSVFICLHVIHVHYFGCKYLDITSSRYVKMNCDGTSYFFLDCWDFVETDVLLFVIHDVTHRHWTLAGVRTPKDIW